MSKPFTVALVCDHYVGWVGGASLLGCLAEGLLHAAAASSARVHLLLSARRLPADVQARMGACVAVPAEALRVPGPLGALMDAAPQVRQVIFYRDLRATLHTLEVDVIGPSGLNLGADCPVPWFSYIPDFQHHHLPDNFPAEERRARDLMFRDLLEHSAGVFVNSASVANDIARFHPGTMARKRVLRFPMLMPEVAAGLARGPQQAMARHGIGGPYLLSCSQRWKHKQHDLIVHAFARHVAACPDSPLRLVFTSERHDYRDPGHGPAVDALIDTLGLGARVLQIGLIPREDQLQLIAGAQAVVSASLFEGGPGASATIEAVLLGTPVLASGIEPNRELAWGDVRYFDPHDAAMLASLIGTVATTAQPPSMVRGPLFSADAAALISRAGGLQTLVCLRGAMR